MNEQTPLNRRPAVRLALLLIGGILFANVVSLDSRLIYIITVVCFLLGIFFWFWLRKPAFSALFFSAAFFLVGSLLYTNERQATDDLRLVPKELTESVSFEGVIDTKPVVRASQLRFVAEIRSMIRGDSSSNRSRRVIVSISRKKETEGIGLRVGSTIQAVGVLEPFPLPRNPGEFNYGRYLELNDIHGVIRVHEFGDLKLVNDDGTTVLQRALDAVRLWIAQNLDDQHGAEQASFLKGIILADRGEIAPELKQSFVDTGTIHVLAVSGLHVGIVALVFYAVFGLLRLRKQAIVLATIAGLIVYLLLTGSAPSVVRATIMASIILLGQLFERRTDIYNSLSVAALIILLWDPKQLFNVGFQLSFAAVLSIVALYPILAHLIKNIPERFEEIKAIDYVLKLFAVSLAAQIGTLPFTAFYFERVSIVSLVANLVVVPIVGLNVMISFASLASSLVSSWLAHCYSALNNFLVSFLLGFVKAASSVPFAYVETSHLTARFPVYYYIGVVGLIYAGQPRVRNRAIIVGLFILSVFAFSDVLSPSKPHLQVTALDVGQGDALFIEFPNKQSMLIDAGPKTFSTDAGKNVIVPFLKRKGIERIDAVVISHPHSDHIGGLPYILDHVRVGRIIESRALATSSLYTGIHEQAHELGITLRPVGVGDTLQMDRTARIYVLHPFLPADSAANLNNTSIVLKLLYGRTSFMLMGDAEREAERKILKRYGPMLTSSVLKAGHHGSITSSSEDFLRSAAPKLAVISVGRNNKFRHPSRAVIERMRRMLVEAIRTDMEAAVLLQSDGSEIKKVLWRR